MRLIARRSFVIHKDTEATRPGALVKTTRSPQISGEGQEWQTIHPSQSSKD